MTKTTPSPPEHLEESTKLWWRSVVKDYDLEPHHLRLLQLAAEAWDRGQLARWAYTFEGVTVETPNGPRAHPAVKLTNECTVIFARLIRELDLDVEPPPSERVGPPPIKSNRG